MHAYDRQRTKMKKDLSRATGTCGATGSETSAYQPCLFFCPGFIVGLCVHLRLQAVQAQALRFTFRALCPGIARHP
jgi:hypothetical protein